MQNNKPFEVGDRVIIMPGRWSGMEAAKEAKVVKVHKSGNFAVDATGAAQYRNPSGWATSSDPVRATIVEHWTAERAAEISHAKLAVRVANKVARLSHNDVKALSTDQLCRIEALLDKITEERAKEGKDA